MNIRRNMDSWRNTNNRRSTNSRRNTNTWRNTTKRGRNKTRKNCICGDSRKRDYDSKLSSCFALYVPEELYDRFWDESILSSEVIWSNPDQYFDGGVTRSGTTDLGVLFPVSLASLKDKYWVTRFRAICRAFDVWLRANPELDIFATFHIKEYVEQRGKKLSLGMYTTVLGGAINSPVIYSVYDKGFHGNYADPGNCVGMSALIDHFGERYGWEGYIAFQASFPRLHGGKLKYSDISFNYTANGKMYNSEAHCDCHCSGGKKKEICENDGDVDNMRKGIARELREETGLVPNHPLFICGGYFTWAGSGASKYRGYWGNFRNFTFENL